MGGGQSGREDAQGDSDANSESSHEVCSGGEETEVEEIGDCQHDRRGHRYQHGGGPGRASRIRAKFHQGKARAEICKWWHLASPAEIPKGQ